MKSRRFSFWFWDIEVIMDRRYRASFWKWLKSLWHPRLTRAEIEKLYRPVPWGATNSEMSASTSATGTSQAERPAGWGPPAFRPEGVLVSRMATKEEDNAAVREMPDWSHLSDEELAEKMKKARLGDGLIAEAGVRAWRRGEMSEEPRD